MGNNLSEDLKNLNLLVKKATNNEEIICNVISETSDIFDANVILVDSLGEVIFEKHSNLPSIAIQNALTGKFSLEPQLISQLNSLNENKTNVTFDNLYTTVIDKEVLKKVYGVFLPIIGGGKKVGLLIIYRGNEKFEEKVYIINEYLNGILSITLANNISNKNDSEERSLVTVKSAIATLSYSELEAIISIFDELSDNEGILVASKIADKVGITRSVIVNALRKFESAGIIETRSLGMKGTHIKILNENLKLEINKFKK